MNLQVISEHSIPNSILTKLYDSTGTSSGGNRGFFLMYINSEGIPSIVSKVENSCVDMALSKLTEIFINQNNEVA